MANTTAKAAGMRKAVNVVMAATIQKRAAERTRALRRVFR
jgi:hypothetical protein